MDTSVDQLCQALESLDRARIDELFQAALARQSPMEVAEGLIASALQKLGDGWMEGRLALSQVYMGSRLCEGLVERVLPPVAPERRSQPRHAIVVLNDYHMLGRRIVLSVMRASGFDTLDYGRMGVDELVQRVLSDDVKILLISTLMLPAALKVKDVREALDARKRLVRIAVGGAPFLFDPKLWHEVGADAMGCSAVDAVNIVRRWMEEMA